MSDFKFSQANRDHLAEGHAVVCVDYSHDGNEDVITLDGIDCKFIYRRVGYPVFMRLDKYLEQQDNRE